ncbi:MAG: hypothetical protein PHQ03_01995 [Methylococcales bacterium]|nr:hypothetical protein [Methylococcales bacterium]
MKKKTRIELMKISLELTIATLDKSHGDNVTDDKVIESFEKCYKAVVNRFNERAIEEAKDR